MLHAGGPGMAKHCGHGKQPSRAGEARIKLPSSHRLCLSSSLNAPLTAELVQLVEVCERAWPPPRDVSVGEKEHEYSDATEHPLPDSEASEELPAP